MKRFLVSFIGQWFPANSSGGNGGDAAEGQTGRSVYAAEGFARVMAACITLLVVLSMGMSAIPGAEAAANAKNFDAGYIISDSRFYDSNAMTASQIQTFLNQQVPTCHPEWDSSPSTIVCLKDYKTTSTSKTKDSYCAGYAGGQSQSAAQIIDGVARSCGVSQQILLVLLQKENGLVTHSWPSPWRYKTAMGYGCPDTAACDSQYYGFFNQVYNAARQYKLYQAKPASYQYRIGSNNIYWNPNASCGYSTVTIRNQATAGLYNYTPYQPNQAALNAGYGSGNSCSSYGNRNFYLYYSDWFGDPKTEAPQSNLDVSKMAKINFSDSTYFISSLTNNALSLDIAGGQTGDGTSAQLYGYNKSKAQQFELKKQTDGSYEIRNKNSAKVLDVKDGVAQDGAQVRQWSANGSSAQRWFVRGSATGYYIQSALGNWVLDVSDGRTATGASVRIFSPNSSRDQMFLFSSVDVAIPQNTHTKISTKLNSNLVLDVKDGSVAENADIQLYPWNQSNAQLFDFNEVGNNIFTIKNVQSAKLVEVPIGTHDSETTVKQRADDGTITQHWAALGDSEGLYVLANAGSGKVLDVANGYAASNSRVQIYEGNGSKAQKFQISSYQNERETLDRSATVHRSDLADGEYFINSISQQTLKIDVRNGATFDRSVVQLFGMNYSDAQRWEVSHDSLGYVYFTNVRSGKVLDIDGADKRSGAKVQQYSLNGSLAQKWIAIKRDNNSYWVYSALASNRVLDVTGGEIVQGNLLQSYMFNGSIAQQWLFTQN